MSRSWPTASCCIWVSRWRSWRPKRRARSRKAARRCGSSAARPSRCWTWKNRSAAKSFLVRGGGLRAATSMRRLAAAPHRLSGVFTSGGQEQFYLESQAAIAYPGEQGQMVVHSSTQNPTEIQAVVAEMLGVGQHEVVCICKRMGGAFGGKESQAAIPGDDGRARGPQDGPPGTRHLQQGRRHARDRQAARVSSASGKSASTTTAESRRCAWRFIRTAACRPTCRWR